MDLSFQDARKLWSLLWHKEQLLDKKRRWIMGSPTQCTAEGNQKMLKNPKFLADVSLPESYIRSDEVSFDTVRINVERSFGSSIDGQEGHHVVQDYLQLFDLHKMESYSVNPSNFLKIVSSIMNDLNYNGLCLVASIITHNKVSFVKNRPRMKKIITEYLRKVLAESNCKDRPTTLQQLSQIFRNPRNFRGKQLTLVTPITPRLLSSIYETLEELDKIPFQDVMVVNRKLRGKTVVPRLSRVLSGPKREIVVGLVRKRCEKILSLLKEGVDLPKPLSKALSVMRLSLKQRTRCVDIPTSEFFPFSPEIIGLQDDILQALWSLSKVKYYELKALQPLVDPEASIPRKTFRIAVRKYLMECLFECGEIDLPEEALCILAFINKRSKRRHLVCSKDTREEDIEAVLNVSSRLKQTVQDLLPDRRIDEASSEGLESDDGNESNDFELVGNGYCSKSSEREDQEQIHSSFADDETEATGDSRPVSFDANGNYSSQLARATSGPSGMILKEPKLEKDADVNNLRPCSKESAQRYPQSAVQESQSMREMTIQEICDETSLVSYGLVGRMLDKFLLMEGRDVDAMTRSYLRGGSSSTADPQCVEDSLCTSNQDASFRVLMQAVQELIPSLPKSSIGRVKELMELP